MQNQKKWLGDFLACRKLFDNENSEVWNLTLKTFDAAFSSGALNAKEKHLMAVALGVKDHCAPCTLGHLQAALKAGRHQGGNPRNNRRDIVHVRNHGHGGRLDGLQDDG